MNHFQLMLAAFLIFAGFAVDSRGDDAETVVEETTVADQEKARNDRFQKQMSGVQLRGNFTITGKEDAGLKEETYVIKRITKMPKDDYWLFHATIRYGGKNVTFPIPLQVKWAGDTPIITVDKVTIPTLGTFNSRVVIDDGKYAGTWTHGEVGGHLFGIVEPLKEENENASE